MKEVQFRPLFFICFYILFTLSMTFWGPIEYFDYNYLSTIIYMLLIIIFIFMGYFLSVLIIKKKINSASYIKSGKENTSFKNKKIIKIVKISIIIALVLEVLLFIDNILTFRILGFGDLISRVINVGDTYKEVLQLQRETTGKNALVQIITLFGITKQIAIVGAYYYRKELYLYKKVVYFFLAILLLNTLAFNGQQKLFADLFIYFLSITYIKHIQLGLKINKKRIIVLISLLIIAFIFIQLSRADAYGYSFSSFSNAYFKYNNDHFFYLLGDSVGGGLASIIYYFSGGYYGLSKSIMLPFEWTYGIGNSIALSSYMTQYLGVPFMGDYTYLARAESITGYPALQYWSTIFPWLASDFTFAGTLVVFFFISWLYAKTWIESIKMNNILSMMLFTRLNIMWAFLPANNQLMQTRESAIATLVLFFMWFVYHKKTNFTIEKDNI